MTSTTDGGWTPVTRADAITTGWNIADKASATVTRAFDEWILTDRYHRAHLQQTLQLAADRYEAIRSDVSEARIASGRAPEYPFADEVVLADSMHGLWPADYEWFTLSALVKDAVTAYEVYVRNACAEVLAFHGLRWEERSRAPGWDQLRRCCKLLGLDPRPPALSEVFALRNVLTHSRGELRNAQDREQLANQGKLPFSSDVAPLSKTSVEGYIDALGATVRELDPVLWVYSWGGYRVP